MKLSVSLAEDDVVFLDQYAQSAGISSRSAALRQAVRLLRFSELDSDYADAWQEWDEQSDDWDATVSDGLAL
ncbi:MAG TPA: ribbon-helix-helix domain-containing protein [Acidimicrobiia bacterium]|nr:ribbon-helix-helix domain-containing protein [Acidimicrobiia bacterium]